MLSNVELCIALLDSIELCVDAQQAYSQEHTAGTGGLCGKAVVFFWLKCVILKVLKLAC